VNVIDQAGVLAIATRLQRLSDQIRKDGQQIYKAYGIDFEPKWFPVVFTLHKKPVLSVVEIAAEIGYSHPSTISLLKELEKLKLIRSFRDKTDERRRLIQLTTKGREMITLIEPVWKIIISATTELMATKNDLMQAIEEVEAQMKQESFLDRALRIKGNKV
jgi:DNA-binding MarR family transcriptional regulator